MRLNKDTRIFPIESRKRDDLKSTTWDWTIKEADDEIAKCGITLEKDHIFIDEITVTEEFRNQNIELLLLTELEEYAKIIGMLEIRGTAASYESEEQKQVLMELLETRGYQLRYDATQAKHIGNFYKKITRRG